MKEKFGTFRVYCDHLDPDRETEVHIQLQALERRSVDVCEWCGAPGELRDHVYAAALPIADVLRRNGWYKTLCPGHAWAFYVDGERWWYEPDWRGARDG